MQPAQPAFPEEISLAIPAPLSGPPYYKVISHADQYRDKVTESGEPATWYAPWTIETYADPACTKPLPTPLQTKYEILTPEIYTWYCQTCDKYDCEHTIMVGREVEKQMDEFCKTEKPGKEKKKEPVPPAVPEDFLKKVADAHDDLVASDEWWTTGPIHNPPCMDEDCFSCAASQCPYKDPLHHHHDECPSCYSCIQESTKASAEEPLNALSRKSP